MPTLSYKQEGRFGNNLIQYCIAKLLCKVFGHTLIDRHDRGASVITDYEWKSLRSDLIQNKENPAFFKSHPYMRQNLRLEGFFQDSTVLVAYRPFLLSLFSQTNPDSITKKYTMKDLVAAIDRTPPFYEILVHLRMDDFRGAGKGHTSVILHPNYFHEILPGLMEKHSIPVRIVYDRKDKEEERNYVNEFARYKPTFQSSDVLLDFATLVKARVLVSSNSTFSWFAAFLASEQVRVFPTICHMGSQNLGAIDSADQIKDSFFVSL
jgi:hypothetical protein